LISWDVRLFWILSFAKDVFVAENWLCFRACNSRIVTYDQEFFLCVVVWFCVFNHFYGIFFFWKVSFETTLSWCCRKHVFVFEIASLKSLSEFMIKLSFSLWLLGEKIWVRHYGQSFENFSVLGVDFLCLF